MTSPAPPIADWRAAASSKRAAVASKIPPEWRLSDSLLSSLNISESSTTNVLSVPRDSGLLSEREVNLTEKHDATALVEMMARGEATSVEVVGAFCKRAAIAHQCVNCLTEIMFEEAMARARECDEYLKKEGKPMGPLHGLPISLKDSFNVKGTHAAIAYISFLAHPPATSNSYLVDVLLAAGAVFYCKTNIPQAMMSADSHNNIMGRTLNPHNLSLTAGGSTGGEGALIAMRGSVMGMGTDIAGSCRIPALCCGFPSFKPTAQRVPFGGGVAVGRLGSPGPILPMIGPMGSSVRDAELAMRTICTEDTWKIDENALHAPWRRVGAISRPLRFGLIRGHPKRPLHPPIARALHQAATKLKEQSHQVVLLDDKIPDLWECTVLAWKFFMLDPQKTALQFIKAGGEEPVPSLKTASPKDVQGWVPSLDEVFDLNVQHKKILKRFHDVIVEHELDAVLMPGHQATAVPHDTYGVPMYTVLVNLLNYPSGILPYLKASKELDHPFIQSEAAYEPPYNPDVIEGMPAHIQVMGKPMQDEELIEVLKVVERTLAMNP